MNGYELLHRIGEGGMGVVHLARREGERRVALKVLRPSVIGDDEARARLAQEVSSLSRIKSLRIAEIVDADPWGDIPYVATRYVPGWSLHQVVAEEGPLPVEDLEHFAGQLVEAMAVVHAVGVVHRDIKPSNVLLEGRNPVLIDFGLARVADDPRLTSSGWMLGTPGYLAPEILYGRDATPASDVHSWAATVAFAATGKPPFGTGPAFAVMDRVRRGEHELSGVPRPLAELLHRALAPEPEDRPSVRELREWFAGPAPVTALHRVPAGLPADQATMPMVMAPAPGEAPDTAPTDRLADAPLVHGSTSAFGPDGPTAALWSEGPGGEPEVGALWSAGELQQPAEEPDRADRIRSGAVTVGLVAVLAGAISVAPWIMVAVLSILVWWVRSASMGAEARRYRLEARGAKWYDAVQSVAGAPWHVLRALPGAALLVSWGAGMAVAVLLLCYAFSAAPVTSLGSAGLVFSAALWLGPGTDRWAPGVARATAPLRRSTTTAALTLGLCLVLAVGLLAVAGVAVHWTPWDAAPVGFLR